MASAWTITYLLLMLVQLFPNGHLRPTGQLSQNEQFPNGQAPDSLNITGCRSDQYWDKSDGTCHDCPSNCTKCESETNCTDCKESHHGQACQQTCEEECGRSCHKVFGHCYHGCPDGQYPIKDDKNPTQHFCRNCTDYCKVCESSARCFECKDGYFGETCKQPCPKHCAQCNISTGQCVQCQDSYYLLQGQCKSCPHGCKLCISSGDCLECEAGFLGPTKGRCLYKCTIKDLIIYNFPDKNGRCRFWQDTDINICDVQSEEYSCKTQSNCLQEKACSASAGSTTDINSQTPCVSIMQYECTHQCQQDKQLKCPATCSIRAVKSENPSPLRLTDKDLADIIGTFKNPGEADCKPEQGMPQSQWLIGVGVGVLAICIVVILYFRRKKKRKLNKDKNVEAQNDISNSTASPGKHNTDLAFTKNEQKNVSRRNPRLQIGRSGEENEPLLNPTVPEAEEASIRKHHAEVYVSPGAEDAKNKDTDDENVKNEDPGTEEVENKGPGAEEVENKDPEDEEVENKDPEDEEVENKDPEDEEVENKDPEDEEVENKDPEDEEVENKDHEAEEVKNKGPGAEEVENKGPGAEEVENKDHGAEEVENKDHGAEEVENKDPGAEEVENKGPGAEEAENKDTEAEEVANPMLDSHRTRGEGRTSCQKSIESTDQSCSQLTEHEVSNHSTSQLIGENKYVPANEEFDFVLPEPTLTIKHAPDIQSLNDKPKKEGICTKTPDSISMPTVESSEERSLPSDSKNPKSPQPKKEAQMHEAIAQKLEPCNQKDNKISSGATTPLPDHDIHMVQVEPNNIVADATLESGFNKSSPTGDKSKSYKKLQQSPNVVVEGSMEVIRVNEGSLKSTEQVHGQKYPPERDGKSKDLTKQSTHSSPPSLGSSSKKEGIGTEPQSMPSGSSSEPQSMPSGSSSEPQSMPSGSSSDPHNVTSDGARLTEDYEMQQFSRLYDPT